MFRKLSLLALLMALAPVHAADMPALRPAVNWLQTERLRGVLFHDPTVLPLRSRYVLPGARPAKSNATITLVGKSYLLLLPDSHGRVGADITAMSGDSHFPLTIFAFFDAAGKQLLVGKVSPGQTYRARLRGLKGVSTLLVNSGPAIRNTARIRPQARSWCLDGGPHSFYDHTPLHLHFLRDLKLGGFNLAMIDFERLPDDFLTKQGLADWTAKVNRWAKYAKKVGLRIMPSVDLGGSAAEVRAWAGCRPGLYINQPANLPLAPCPLDRTYWEKLYLVRAEAVAKLSLTNPSVVGFGLDPEMYQAHLYGHYTMGGTCFCDHCFGGFLDSQGLDKAPLLKQLTTGKQRYEWLKQHKLYPQYDKYLEDQMAQLAAWCRDQLHAINPNFLTDMFVTEIGNWFCRGVARGFGEPGVPTLDFAEHTYYGVGYDPAWLTSITDSYREWGAQVVQGSALWDLYFPATDPRFFAAHAYNLATKGQGYWYWPGDDLYRDWGCRNAFYGRPAWYDEFWPAAVWANHEIDAWTKDHSHVSPLDNYEPVPWRGKRNNKKGTWTTDPSVATKLIIPAYPVHVPAPTTLYFRVPPRRPEVSLAARLRLPGGKATVALYDPAGKLVDSAPVTDQAEARLRAEQAGPGVWRLQVTGTSPEVMLNLSGPRPFLATSPEALPGIVSKPPGLVGWWKLDEGKGEVVADSSHPPCFDGTMRGATWVPGVGGAALAFNGQSGEVSIPMAEPFNNLTTFTLCAWVKLNSLSTRGHGRTILNKGPEAPVQHLWWWIGYPPNNALTLEMGDAQNRYGVSFATGKLAWQLGRWYHLAVTFQRQGDVCTVCHYRDGKLVGKIQRTGDLNSGSYDLRLGSYGGLHWMDGAIDDVKFFDTVLTPQEISREAGPEKNLEK